MSGRGRIGFTMAIGASENDVIRLVLYECLLIGIVGGSWAVYLVLSSHR